MLNEDNKRMRDICSSAGWIAYLRKTFSICFDWKRPLIINCWLPSIEPLVPNSASKKSNKCFGCLFEAYSNHFQFSFMLTMCVVDWRFLPVQCFANICEVGKRRLFCADAQYLWRSHNEFWLPASSHVGIFVQNDFEHTAQQFIVRVIPIRTKPRCTALLNCKQIEIVY